MLQLIQKNKKIQYLLVLKEKNFDGNLYANEP